MKKLLVILTATLVSLGAFAQGKVGFSNDGNHLVYYDPSVGGSLGGHTVQDTRMPAGVTLVADLYMSTSTSSSVLNLYSTTTFSSIAGAWTTAQVLAGSPFIAGGTRVNVQIQVRDQAAAPPAVFTGAVPGSLWYGSSAQFQFTLGGSVTYPPLYGPNGNWPQGSFNLDGVDGSPVGSRGAIAVSVIPEPTSFALAGLGAAAMLIFRRRK
jgi:hypothetical protein